MITCVANFCAFFIESSIFLFFNLFARYAPLKESPADVESIIFFNCLVLIVFVCPLK